MSVVRSFLIGISLTGAVVFGSSCAGRPPAAPTGQEGVFGTAFAKAAATEQLEDAEAAIAAYLAVLDQAVAQPDTPHALEAVLASLDALVTRHTPGLDKVAGAHALALRRSGAIDRVLARLENAYGRANGTGPFARGAIARAAHELALYQGNQSAAERWRVRSGCARRATVIGPLDWPPVTAAKRSTPVEGPSGKLAASYPGVAPFATAVVPTTVSADGCDLPLMATSVLEGLRAVVVDVDVPRRQEIGIVLETPSAAAVVAGGKVVLSRGYELGGARVEKLGTAQVEQGRLRVVVRVGSNGEESTARLRIYADDGTPLTTHAPKPGDTAAASVGRTADLVFHVLGNDPSERALVAQAMMALGDGRAAEHLLEQGNQIDTDPLTSLEYARAITQAQDLPETRAIERQRAAYDAVLRAWPSSWEGLLGHAQLTARRRGTGEGRVEALGALREARNRGGRIDPLVRAYEAAIASEGQLFDIAEQAYADVEKALRGGPLVTNLSLVVHDRVGKERVERACRRTPDTVDQNSFDCLAAKVNTGDRRGALDEIARLRVLRGSPDALRALELAQYVALGDIRSTLRVYDSMRPAERTLGVLGLALTTAPAELKTRLESDILSAADSPGILASLYTALRETPAPDWEAEARRIVAADRKSPSMSNAATAVLRHVERYSITESGLLRYSIFDLRRVSGTTDVDQGADAGSALIEGRDVQRVLRRRIHKPDGRVLEPDRTARGAQDHAELSQLEKGDYVEQILDGWALPGASGQLVVDTPDLMPERTSIDEATIEVRRPAALRLSLWAHALIGRPVERVEGKEKVTTFSIRKAPPRRIEDGVPKMDRDVAVSFGTSSWEIVGRSIAEAAALLVDRDPTVARWAQEAAGLARPAPNGTSSGMDHHAAATPSGSTSASASAAAAAKAVPSAVPIPVPGAAPIPAPLASPVPQSTLVERVVAAVGKSVKVASGAILSDSAAALSGGAQATGARTILELGQGSRTWLAYRALRELGISSDLVIAEREPFSADPSYPAHFGRFEYPLIVAHTERGDLWLDVDVQGPPLPAGRISPELRGRWAMTTGGKIVRVEGLHADQDRDEVDIRLNVDERGDATGSFSILLRGRTAQTIADALEKVVGTDRRDMLEAVVLGWLPWANVNEVALSSTEGSWQVSLRAEVMIPGFAQPERSSWVLPGLEPLHSMFPRGGVGTLGATFASRGERESALAIDTAFQYHVHRRVELGPNTTLARPLAGIQIRDELLQASRAGTFESGVLEENFTLSIPTGTLDATTYREFASDARRIDDAFQTATRIHRNRATK